VIAIKDERLPLQSIPPAALHVMPEDAESAAPWQLRPCELKKLEAASHALLAFSTF
jgi:hypothetical protein